MARKTRQGHGCTWDASHQEVSKTALCKWKHALQLKLEEDERAGVSRGGTAFRRSFGLGCFQGEVISARAALARAGSRGWSYRRWPRLGGGLAAAKFL